jgi:hypothetical protein
LSRRFDFCLFAFFCFCFSSLFLFSFSFSFFFFLFFLIYVLLFYVWNESPWMTSLAFVDQGLTSLPASLATLSAPLSSLDLSHNAIASFAALAPFASSLQSLIADDNGLCCDTLQSLPPLPTLDTLWLNRNQLHDLPATMGALKTRCPRLTYLSMLGNPLCPFSDPDDYGRYRHFVLFHMPTLRFLDATAVDDSERTEAQRVGPFLKFAPVKITNNNSSNSSSSSSSSSGTENSDPNATSSSSSGMEKENGKKAEEDDALDDVPQSKGTAYASMRKYVYHGKASEGNRFIHNQDL